MVVDAEIGVLVSLSLPVGGPPVSPNYLIVFSKGVRQLVSVRCCAPRSREATRSAGNFRSVLPEGA
jgi:hypothetical protein